MAYKNTFQQDAPQAQTAIPMQPQAEELPKRIPQPPGQRFAAILVSYFWMYLALYMYQDNPGETAFWLPVGIGACFVISAVWPTARNPALKKK